jgi:O-antigen/teichoic acid export membrane protein
MAPAADERPSALSTTTLKVLRLFRVLAGTGSSGVAGRLASGSFWSFLIAVAGSALGFVVQYLLVRGLGPTEFGHYVYILGWVNAAAVLVKFELDTVATRFVSSYHALHQPELMAGFLGWGARRVVIASVTTGLVAGIALSLVLPRVAPAMLAAALVGCIILPVTSVTLFVQNCLQGIKWIRAAYFPPQVLRPLLLMTAIFGAARVTSLTAGSALALNLGAAVLALVVSLQLLRRGMVGKLAYPGSLATREWLDTAAGLVPAALAQLVLSQASDVLVVGTLLGPVEAGKYSVAGQLASLAGYVIGPVASITAPLVAELHARQDKPGLRQLMRLVARINLGIILPMTLLVILGGPWLLHIFGPLYAQAYPVLVLLSLGMVSATVGGTASFLLTMTGNHREAARIIGGTAALNLVLAILLTPRFGAIGTASATLGATIVRNAWMIRAAQARSGISLMPW